MFTPTRASQTSKVDTNEVITKVLLAKQLARDDYTVLEELRSLKKQLKKELFSGFLLASLAQADAGN